MRMARTVKVRTYSEAVQSCVELRVECMQFFKAGPLKKVQWEWTLLCHFKCARLLVWLSRQCCPNGLQFRFDRLCPSSRLCWIRLKWLAMHKIGKKAIVSCPFEYFRWLSYIFLYICMLGLLQVSSVLFCFRTSIMRVRRKRGMLSARKYYRDDSTQWSVS